MTNHPERGQAAVEFLAALPALLIAAAVAAQLCVAGYSSVLAGNAAEAAALALAGGGDPHAAARAALPGWTRSRARMTVTGGKVHLRLRPPGLLRPLARKLEVHAEAAVEAP